MDNHEKEFVRLFGKLFSDLNKLAGKIGIPRVLEGIYTIDHAERTLRLMIEAVRNRPIFNKMGMIQVSENKKEYIVSEKIDCLLKKYPKKQFIVSEDFKNLFFKTKTKTTPIHKDIFWRQLENSNYFLKEIFVKLGSEEKVICEISDILSILEQLFKNDKILPDGRNIFFVKIYDESTKEYVIHVISLFNGFLREYNSRILAIGSEKLENDMGYFFLENEAKIFSFVPFY